MTDRARVRGSQPRDESLTSVLVALAANLCIAAAKGIAAALTGSPALFAETLHTLADAGNEVPVGGDPPRPSPS